MTEFDQPEMIKYKMLTTLKFSYWRQLWVSWLKCLVWLSIKLEKWIILSSAFLLLVVCDLAIQTECTREVKHCYFIRSECASCMCAGNPIATEEDRKNCFCDLEKGEYYLKPQVPLGMTSYCQPFRFGCSAGKQPTQQGQLSVFSCLSSLLLVNSPHSKVSCLSSVVCPLFYWWTAHTTRSVVCPLFCWWTAHTARSVVCPLFYWWTAHTTRSIVCPLFCWWTAHTARSVVCHQLSVLSSTGEQPTQQGQLSVLSCLSSLLLVNSPHKVSYLSSLLLTVWPPSKVRCLSSFLWTFAVCPLQLAWSTPMIFL